MGKIVEEPFSGKEEDMEKKELTNWQAVGIGLLIGIIPLILLIVFFGILKSTAPELSGGVLETFFFTGYIYVGFCSPGILIGIVGALIGKNWKKTRRATWSGAILGAILGIGAWGLLWTLLGELPIYLPQ